VNGGDRAAKWEVIMETIAAQTGAAAWSVPAAYLAIASVAVSCLALVTLHFASPELAPSWRMVSEYANGEHEWLLTLVFAAWALSSFALLVALWPISESTLGKVGLALLILAGIGQAMGGLFDINHKLHGPAAMIGIPSLCAAAIVVTIALGRRADIEAPPLWSAHLPWIGFILMMGTLFMFFSSLKAAGVDVAAQSGPLRELPPGVSGYVGWANRLLFAAAYLWVLLASISVLRAGR
jgi:hypothetical membrane protein